MPEPAARHDQGTVPVGAPRASTLRIPSRLLNRIIGRAARGYPHEVCGLLLGSAGEDGIRVERNHDARNLAEDRPSDRYTLDPRDFLAADTDARRAGLEIVGIWHTHPDHPARPSETDRSKAWPGYVYLILSVRREGVVDLTGWRLDGARFVEHPVEEVPQ